MAMIGNDPHNAYYLGYPLFCALPDPTIKVSYFEDVNKNMHFYYIDCGM